MPKTSLGRGLGYWLKKRPVGDVSCPGGTEPDTVSGVVTPGVEVLLRGSSDGNHDLETESRAGQGMPLIWKYWGRLKWILWAGDILLIALTAILLLQNSRPPGFWEAALCTLGFGTGTALAILAVVGAKT